jgi:hypothetical protein
MTSRISPVIAEPRLGERCDNRQANDFPPLYATLLLQHYFALLASRNRIGYRLNGLLLNDKKKAPGLIFYKTSFTALKFSENIFCRLQPNPLAAGLIFRTAYRIPAVLVKWFCFLPVMPVPQGFC